MRRKKQRKNLMLTRSYVRLGWFALGVGLLACSCAKEPDEIISTGDDDASLIVPEALVGDVVETETKADLSGVVIGTSFPANYTKVFSVVGYKGTAAPTNNWSSPYIANIAVNSGASSASAGQGSTGVKANNNAHNAAAADGSTGIPLIPSGGVRYTVPQSIRLSHMEDSLLVRFRVGSVFTDAVLTVTAGDTCLLRQKKKKLAPGEMQQIILKKSAIPADAQSITICVAKEEG